jgi:hypothetical protein
MLSQLAVDHGVVNRAMFLVIGPRLNRRINAAVRLFQNELIDVDDRDTNRIDFKALTLEAVIESIAEAGATEIAAALWRRYADFQRILDLSLLEFQANDEFSTSTKHDVQPTSDTAQPKLPVVASINGPYARVQDSTRGAMSVGSGSISRKPNGRKGTR